MMTNPDLPRKANLPNGRLAGAVPRKAYLGWPEGVEDFADDGFWPEDDDDDVTRPQLRCAVVDSLGKQRLHVEVTTPGEPAWETFIQADSQDEMRQAARDAAERSGQSV